MPQTFWQGAKAAHAVLLCEFETDTYFQGGCQSGIQAFECRAPGL